MKIHHPLLFACLLLSSASLSAARTEPAPARPNIILIYADDLGYGDLGCYGGKAIPTPNIDKLAAGGLRFTDAYATSSTCTPSRYALLTGEYPWRKKGTNILQGDAPLIIPPGSPTLPAALQKAGYQTAVIGKWHLGLGSPDRPADWNGLITPGPREIGFDQHFIMAATGDRVPIVYVENQRVPNLDLADPISVSYTKKIGDEPTGRTNPGLLTMKADDQHSDTLINGIGRIGYMSGGKAARWKDEELGDHFTQKAVAFITAPRPGPFFLFFALHEPHAPRVPAPRFAGKTSLGPRGDAIVQIDSHVGAVLETLDRLKLRENTLILLSSDNGPVLYDGYYDEADTKNGTHRPAGPYNGGKYSKLEAGTRVPLISSWPAGISPGVSAAPISQIDFPATLAALAGQPAPGPDGISALDVLLGKSTTGRPHIVQQGVNGLALRVGDWKFIPASPGSDKIKTMRTGNLRTPQLYQLSTDPGETQNLASTHPDKVMELTAVLRKIESGSTSEQ